MPSSFPARTTILADQCSGADASAGRIFPNDACLHEPFANPRFVFARMPSPLHVIAADALGLGGEERVSALARCAG